MQHVICQTKHYGIRCNNQASWFIGGGSVVPHFTCESCKNKWLFYDPEKTIKTKRLNHENVPVGKDHQG